MFTNKWIRMAVIATGLAGAMPAATIADLTADYTTVAPTGGWQYLRNTGTIGNDANYTALLWDAGFSFYDTTGGGFPGPGPEYTLFAGAGVLHPGLGTTQGSGFDRYVILAYTIQAGEAGAVNLVNGAIGGNDPNGAGGNSNGWDIQIYVGNVQAGSTLLVPWSLSDTGFSQSLGVLNVGDTVYVAVGPNGNHLYDSAHVQFQLDSTSQVPEPQTYLMLGVGLAGLAARRKR